MARTEWITDPRRFAALGPDWERLARHDATPFSSHAWFSTWWRAFGDGALRTCAVWDDDELIAALPLQGRRGRLRALANDHTPAYRPLARDAWARELLAAALRGLTLELSCLPAAEAGVRELVAAMEDHGARTLLEPEYVSPLTGTAGAFDDYRAEMKSRWREVERRGRKLSREHEVEERLVDEPAELERELSDGLALEASGWKGQAGTAMLASQETEFFYRELARAFHEAGELRFSALRVDGRLAAFDFALLHRGRYFLLKTAYDEDLRTLAPGLVLRRSVIERCFELGLEAHEFLGPDMEWKRLFSTDERPHFVWRAYPRRPSPLLRHAYRRHVRPRLKRAYLRARGSR